MSDKFVKSIKEGERPRPNSKRPEVPPGIGELSKERKLMTLSSVAAVHPIICNLTQACIQLLMICGDVIDNRDARVQEADKQLKEATDRLIEIGEYFRVL